MKRLISLNLLFFVLFIVTCVWYNFLYLFIHFEKIIGQSSFTKEYCLKTFLISSFIIMFILLIMYLINKSFKEIKYKKVFRIEFLIYVFSIMLWNYIQNILVVSKYDSLVIKNPFWVYIVLIFFETLIGFVLIKTIIKQCKQKKITIIN